MIITKPLAGLANKLRVIESAISLGNDLNAPVEVVWVPDFQMVAHYRDLFAPSELFRITDHDKYKFCRSSFSVRPYIKPFSKCINYFYGIDVAVNEVDIRSGVNKGKMDIASLAKGKTIYIDTCHNFYAYHYNFSWVKPIPAIADKIASLSEIVDQRNCIGMHIRRTDNAHSIRISPNHLFETAIRNEIAQNDSTVFFLATDSLETQAHFVALFGSDRILFHEKKFGRDSVAAIQDAVVDWFLLTKCRKLYCSYFSSFSETAAAVSGVTAAVLMEPQ